MTMKKEKREIYLPDECWEQILEHGGFSRGEICNASLNSKQLLSVCDHFVTSLHIRGISDLFGIPLPKLLKRFKHVTKISISDCFCIEQLNLIILDIARSGLDLQELHIVHPLTPFQKQDSWDRRRNEFFVTMYDIYVKGFRELGSTMKNLKVVRFEYGLCLTINELVFIASCFPQLEEFDGWKRLHHTHVIKGETIDFLAGMFKGLRRVRLDCRESLTDEGLIHLSKNCLMLSEVIIRHHGCKDGVTEKGVNLLLQNSRHLVSFELHSCRSCRFELSTEFGESVSCAKSLTDLKLDGVVVSDAVIKLISKANLPLKKLAFHANEGFTCGRTLSSLLHAYQSITHLYLSEITFVHEQLLNEVSASLKKLAHLEISPGHNLTDSTMFKLMEHCPLLVEFDWIGSPDVQQPRASCISVPQWKNYNIQKLLLGNNLRENLMNLDIVCPNLQELHLYFSQEGDQGLEDILKSCCNLRCLGLHHLSSTGFRPESEVRILNLEELLIAGSEIIGDEELKLMAKIFPRLRRLMMISCEKVTTMGLKKVLELCDVIEEINIEAINNLRYPPEPGVNYLELLQEAVRRKKPDTWRKIIVASRHLPNQDQLRYCLEHGCLVTSTSSHDLWKLYKHY